MSKKQKEHAQNYINSNEDLNPASIFNNKQFKEAFNSLPKEEQEKYKKIGEDLYNTIDYINTGMTLAEQDPNEVIAFIENQLRSGIHPSDMEEGEKLIMSDTYGEEWYTKWGYVKEDLNDIITIKQ